MAILNDVSEALVYLHSRKPPIMHRNVSSANIVMTRIHGRDVARLSSFKLAKECTLNIDFYKQCHDSIKGTPSYMSAEFFMEDIRYTAYADVFSLGLLFALILNYSKINKGTHPNSGK